MVFDNLRSDCDGRKCVPGISRVSPSLRSYSRKKTVAWYGPTGSLNVEEMCVYCNKDFIKENVKVEEQRKWRDKLGIIDNDVVWTILAILDGSLFEI